MNSEIEKQCDQIIAAVSAVITKGCDDVATHNIAQLRGIWQSAQIIKKLNKEGEKNA